MKKDSFEEKMREIEEIAQKLENADTDIDEAIELFSRGAALIRELNARLDEAEKRINGILSEEEENEE